MTAETLDYEAHVFAATYPTPASHPYGGDGSWDQDCGRVMFRFGEWLGWASEPRGDISSAWRVAMASGRLNPDPEAAAAALQAGCLVFHFWDIAGPDNGHVGAQLHPDGRVFMGSAGVWTDLGVDIGYMTVDGYQRYRPHARYLGWATNYAGGTVDVTRYQTNPTPTPTTRGNMTMGNRQYYARITEDGADAGEWMLAGADIRQHPTDPKQDGYRVTTDKSVARLWARQYGINPNATGAVRLTRANYIRQQEFAREDAREHREALRAIVDASLAAIEVLEARA